MQPNHNALYGNDGWTMIYEPITFLMTEGVGFHSDRAYDESQDSVHTNLIHTTHFKLTNREARYDRDRRCIPINCYAMGNTDTAHKLQKQLTKMKH